MKGLLTTVAMLFLVTLTFSQDKMNWGVIPQEEMDLKECPFEADATAMVLKDRGVIEFSYLTGPGWTVNLKNHRRIKVFDKNAADQGDLKISYYHKHRITNLKAHVISPNGNIVPVLKDDIFDEKINRYYKSKNFAVPNLQDGSVIEITYVIETKNVFSLFEWFFQEDIPVLKSELVVTIPNMFNYVYLYQGSVKPNVDTKQRTINYGVQTKGSTVKYISMDNIPSIKEEAFITTMDNYKRRMRFQLSSYVDGYGASKPVLTSWEEINKEMIDDVDFGKRVTGKMNYKKANQALSLAVPGLESQSPEDKLKSIYTFVQRKMEWDGYTSIYAKEKLDQSFEKGKGTVSEINLLLTALLNANGVETDPVLISTRKHGKHLPLYPFLDQFNYLISVAKIEGEHIFMDASSEFNPPGILPLNALNEKGFKIKEDAGEWIDIPNIKNKEKCFVKGKLSEDGSFQGEYISYCDNFSAMNERKTLIPEGKDEFSAQLESKFDEIEIEEVAIENLIDIDKPLKATVKCEIPNMLSVSGDMAYLSPILERSFDENPFKLEKRTYPVEIPYPFKEQFVLAISLPENFTVEELPKNILYKFPENGGSFTYTAKLAQNQLIINSDLDINQTKFMPFQYDGLKELFEKIIEKQNEQIVFKIN